MSIRLLVRPAVLASWLSLAAVGCATDVPPAYPVAPETETLSPNVAAQLPKELAVPEGQHLKLQFRAEGVQVYGCTASDPPTPPAWVLTAPDAKLFDRHARETGKHYAGPTWEALDGSALVGAKLASAAIDATAIPWLLLQAASHSGTGLLSDVSYVQRLETVGGLAPTDGCDAAHLGEVKPISYTANYAFYAPDPKP